jgi:voltage-gated potassium channel
VKKRHRHSPIRKFLLGIFDDSEHPYFNVVNHFLAVTTLVAVAAVALETMPSLSAYQPLFTIIEYVVVVIFSAEYALRIALAKQPLRYIFSFFGLIDLIAIIPSFLGLTNLTFLKAARAVRIVRLLRMLRLARFAKIKRRKNAAQSLYVLNLEIYAISLFIAVLLLGTLFYIFEPHPEATSIPSGMYWALRAVLGGMPYAQPETMGGTITLILARFTSMVLLGMMMGLVATMMRKLLIGAEKDS